MKNIVKDSKYGDELVADDLMGVIYNNRRTIFITLEDLGNKDYCFIIRAYHGVYQTPRALLEAMSTVRHLGGLTAYVSFFYDINDEEWTELTDSDTGKTVIKHGVKGLKDFPIYCDEYGRSDIDKIVELVDGE